MSKNEKFDPKKPLDTYCKEEMPRRVPLKDRKNEFNDFASGKNNQKLEILATKMRIKRTKGGPDFKYMDAETLKNINAKPLLTLSIDRYQKEATRTIDDGLMLSRAATDALLGLSAETGEVCSIFQKHIDGHPFDKDDLVNEIGDVLWFLSELCTVMGISLEECAVKNLLKLLKRYPDGYSAEDAVARKDVTEKE